MRAVKGLWYREERKRDEMWARRKNERQRLSKFHEASSGRDTHYIFLSISGRDWPFQFVSRRVQQRKVLANIHTHIHIHTHRGPRILFSNLVLLIRIKIIETDIILYLCVYRYKEFTFSKKKLYILYWIYYIYYINIYIICYVVKMEQRWCVSMRFVVTPGDTRRELNRLVRPRRLSFETIVLLFTVSPCVMYGDEFYTSKNASADRVRPLFLVAVVATHIHCSGLTCSDWSETSHAQQRKSPPGAHNNKTRNPRVKFNLLAPRDAWRARMQVYPT